MIVDVVDGFVQPVHDSIKITNAADQVEIRDFFMEIILSLSDANALGTVQGWTGTCFQTGKYFLYQQYRVFVSQSQPAISEPTSRWGMTLTCTS